MGFPATPSSFCSAINFILQSAPLPILPDPIINVITVPPKIWRKKAASNYKPSFATMLTRICIPLSPLVNVLSAPLHENPDFVLISFTATNPSIHLNLKEIFVWGIKLTTPLGAPFYLLSNQIGILSVKGAFHVQCLISNSVLTQGIPPLFVVASRSTDTTKGK